MNHGPCQCEHGDHFDGLPASVNPHHAYQDTPAGDRIAREVGPVCDTCAAGHMAAHLLADVPPFALPVDSAPTRAEVRDAISRYAVAYYSLRKSRSQPARVRNTLTARYMAAAKAVDLMLDEVADLIAAGGGGGVWK